MFDVGKRIFLFPLLVLFFFLLIKTGFVQAVTCGSSCNPTDYNCIKNDCEQKKNEAKSTERTLSSQIDQINNQITLTRSQIDLTEQKLDRLNGDIASVSGKIDRISESLDQVSRVLANRIVETYIAGRTEPVVYLLLSVNFSEFFERLDYLRIVQKHDKTLLLQMATAKKNYNDQKDLLEDKKKEVETLNNQLKSYKVQLDRQNKEKQTLLAITQSDEATYQQLLAQAEAQLAAFQGFVSGQGGLTLIDADPGWPKDYYSQRDKRWGGVPIAGPYPSGSNPISIGAAGCLISSVAMTLTHRGNNVTPAVIGSNSSYFYDALFIWSAINSLGFNTPVRTTDRSVVDSILSSGKWAIVGLSYTASTGSTPFHFVVITSKNGDDYNLFDPWRGPNVSFNSNYGSNYITEVISY